VDLLGREHRLAEPNGPQRRRAARRVPALARRGRAVPPQRGVRAGAAHRGRVLAEPARAVVAVPHGRAGAGPGLRPARVHRRGGARAQPRAARLVQPVPRVDAGRSGATRARASRARAPGVDLGLRRQALLRPGPARGAGAHPACHPALGRALRPRRRALRRLLLPLIRWPAR
jgi:hypothetical protein